MKNLIQALNSRIQQGKPSMLITLTSSHVSLQERRRFDAGGGERRIAGTVWRRHLNFRRYKRRPTVTKSGRAAFFAYLYQRPGGRACRFARQRTALFAYLRQATP